MLPEEEKIALKIKMIREAAQAERQIATCTVHLETVNGPATISSREDFNTLGPYTVSGPGKKIAKEWIQNAYGAFGHQIGKYAAPCDLHCAAMELQYEPEDTIRFVRFEGECISDWSG